MRSESDICPKHFQQVSCFIGFKPSKKKKKKKGNLKKKRKRRESCANCRRLISGWMSFTDIERKTLESPICRLTFATQPPALGVSAPPRCELCANCGWESSRRTRLAVTNRHRAKNGLRSAQSRPPNQKKKTTQQLLQMSSQRRVCGAVNAATRQSCWGGFYSFLCRALIGSSGC